MAHTVETEELAKTKKACLVAKLRLKKKPTAWELEKRNLLVWHIYVHVPKEGATKEYINNQVIQAVQITPINKNLDWQQKGQLFVA